MPAHRELARDPHPMTIGGDPSPRVVTMGGDPPPRATLSRKAQAALPLSTVGAGMLVRRVSVRPPDVVFVKGLVEASDGLAGVFAERGGELLLAAPREREGELAELLADLEAELGAHVVAPTAREQ